MKTKEDSSSQAICPHHLPQKARSAFTLLELAFLLGTVAALLTVAGHGLARTRPITQGSRCLANIRTLMMANMIYSFDNRDALPMNIFGGFVPNPRSSTRPWVTGVMDWSPFRDNTNTTYLLDPRYASLATYFGGDLSIYRCPADNFLSTAQQRVGMTNRLRSVSANLYVGKGNAWVSGADYSLPGSANLLPIYRGAAKSSDLMIPGPARTWVYMDEHPDSINDGGLFPPTSANVIPDLPATYHNGAAGVAMADGHCEMHRWRGPLMNKPRSEHGMLGVDFNIFNLFPTVIGDPDLYWLSFGTPRLTTRTMAD